MIRGVLTVVVILLFAPFSGAQLPQPPVPTLVLYNGKVITVDAAFSIAEAMAIAGERVMAVGTSAQMRAIAAPSTRLVDLRGQTLMPGLMDKGSIEPGKLADFVVLNEDPLTCPEPRLRDAQVMMTIVGGKTVFER